MAALSPMFSPPRAFLSSLAHLRAAAVFLLFLQLFVNPAFASPLTTTDEKSIRAVVEGQLAALAKDDATKAFSYAAPNVRKAIGTANRFLSMVQNDYPVVYRPASVAFLKPEGDSDEVVQRVQMQDASGSAWLAIYSLQRQKGNLWRITGCAVIENRGRMA
jgi:hypothetical protein